MSGVSVMDAMSEHGPCLLNDDLSAGCEHANCAEAHRIAASRCQTCNEPIGYLDTFFDVGEDVAWQSFAHQRCV